MTKALVFDMDGTIADLYGVKNWLNDLHAENARPYEQATPLYDMDKLNIILEMFKLMGYKIIVTTWLAGNNPSKEYDNKVRKAKIDWLKKYEFPYDEIHLVKYGTTKANCTRKKYDYQILIDDNDKILKGWTLGDTIDAKKDICNQLIEKLCADLA